MQRLSRDPGRTVRIIEKISGEWIPQMGKMYTDLVGASGLETDAQQRKSTGRASACAPDSGVMCELFIVGDGQISVHGIYAAHDGGICFAGDRRI